MHTQCTTPPRHQVSIVSAQKNLNKGIKDMPNLRKSSPTYQGLLQHDRFQHPSLANVTLNKEKV